MKPEQIVAEMKAELERRDEWYGLDNWPLPEVVEFVLDRRDPPGLRAAQHPDDPR